MKKFIILLSVFLFIPFCFSQNIKRKGSLGISFYQNIADSLALKLNYKKGIIVKNVLPNLTASNIGIQNNDILIKINNNNIDSPNSLLIEAKKLRENEKILVELIRNNKNLSLSGNVIAKPKESSETARIIYGEFAYKNGYVRTIYKTLKNQKPLGTIYFLQGLPCYSMDNFQELDKTKQALDAMVERGFAVYRIEKGDMGDNVNTPNCEAMGFNEEVSMMEAGYRNLLTLNDIDTSKIFLFGHSMGGITAPLLAEKFQPKGVVVYGTGFKPWLEYLFDAYLIQLQYYGEDLATLRENVEKYKPFLYDYFYNQKPIDEICKNPLGLKAMEEILSYNPETKLGASGRSPLVFKEMNDHNLAKAWGNYKNDVLAIYGECDLAANNAEDHKNLIQYINKKNPGKGTFWLAPGTTHTFEEIGTMEEFINMQKNPQAFYQYAATKFNPKVFDYTCNWMKEILNK